MTHPLLKESSRQEEEISVLADKPPKFESETELLNEMKELLFVKRDEF